MSPLWLLAVALAQDPGPQETPPADPEPTEAPGEEAPEAEAPPADPRDAEIFGAPPPADPRDEDVFGASAPPAASGLGEPTLTDQQIAQRLKEADQRFEIGGLGYLRLDSALAEGDDASTAAFRSPSFVDVYGDARPNDRLRLYLRGRLSHDLTVQSGDLDAFGQELQPTAVALDQLWVKLDIGQRIFVTAGRQRIKWGVGRLWNPTDFLAPSTLDALTVFDERMGVGLLKLHVPFEKTGTDLYLIAELEGARHPDEVGGALRIEQIVGPGEVAATAALRKGEPQELGFHASFPLWLLDLKGEVAVRHGVSAPFWEGGLDLSSGELPSEVDRSEDWIPQALLGTEIGLRYNDQDSLYLGVEYLFNDAGYPDAELYPWLLAQGQFVPFYVGRHYLAAYLSLPGPGRADDHRFTLTALSNLGDKTVIGRFDYAATLLTELSFNAYAQVHGGPTGGELAFAVEVPPIPGELPDGLVVPRPQIDVGLGAQIRF